jgi:uncharacterized membrane protein YkoI
MKTVRFLAVVLLLACLPVLGPTQVAAEDDHGGLRRALERNELVSFKSIVDWIELHYVGKIVEVELEDEDGMLGYEVDLLTPGGDMIEFEFDARTGKLLSITGPNIERARRK